MSHVFSKHTLQHTATHCNTLQHTATQSNRLQHVTCLFEAHTSVEASALHDLQRMSHVALHHTAPQCNTLQHTATQCNTVQNSATQCNTVQHSATHCVCSVCNYRHKITYVTTDRRLHKHTYLGVLQVRERLLGHYYPFELCLEHETQKIRKFVQKELQKRPMYTYQKRPRVDNLSI